MTLEGFVQMDQALATDRQAARALGGCFHCSPSTCPCRRDVPGSDRAGPRQSTRPTAARQAPGSTRDRIGTLPVRRGGIGVGCQHAARNSARRQVARAQHVRLWCGRPDAEVVVKPVIDLAACTWAESDEVPQAITEQVALRDRTCDFPW